MVDPVDGRPFSHLAHSQSHFPKYEDRTNTQFRFPETRHKQEQPDEAKAIRQNTKT